MNRASARLFLAALLGTGCRGSDSTAPGQEPVASVEITPSAATVTMGDTIQLAAVTRAADGTVLTGRTIGWTSSSDTRAIVNGAGQVAGLATGDVTITATSEGVSGTAAIGVTAAAPPPPSPGFEIRSPAIEIQPLQEVTYCYYFHTPNTEPVAVRQWRSQMTAGGRDVSLVLTRSDILPPGTVSTVGCGAVTADVPVTAYVAHQPMAEFTFPADDGSGHPVGQIIPPNQSGHLRVHYHNPSPDQPISVVVEVEAVGYPANTPVTRADPYVAYNGGIEIPALGSASEVDTCATPAEARFFWMSTYSHKFSVRTSIKDGDAVVFESTDFANPGSRQWNTAPFFAFASGTLTYQCDYVNPLDLTIRTGSSHQYEEECIAFAFYFPSTGPRFCHNGILAPSIRHASRSRVPGQGRDQSP